MKTEKTEIEKGIQMIDFNRQERNLITYGTQRSVESYAVMENIQRDAADGWKRIFM